MLNTFSRSLTVWKPTIETWAQEITGGPRTNWGPERAEHCEQFPSLGNYTLTPVDTAPYPSCYHITTTCRLFAVYTFVFL